MGECLGISILVYLVRKDFQSFFTLSSELVRQLTTMTHGDSPFAASGMQGSRCDAGAAETSVTLTSHLGLP